jgi:hypothetical protein
MSDTARQAPRGRRGKYPGRRTVPNDARVPKMLAAKRLRLAVRSELKTVRSTRSSGMFR